MTWPWRTPTQADFTLYPQPVQENENMNQSQITEVSATVDTGLNQDDLDGMTEAERLALVVGAAYGKALAERDQWHALHEAAIDDLVQARRLLDRVVPILRDSSWATDSALADSIQAFLDAEPVDSGQTPALQED